MPDVSPLQFLDAVPSAQGRVLVDMVNCLDVARDHIRVSTQTESDFFRRFVGAVTGESQKRNNRIAQSQQTVLESAVETIKELAKHQTRSNYAIAQVAKRLTYVEESLAKCVNVLMETKDAVRQLRVDVDVHVERLNAEIARLDLRAAASEHMDNVISRWEAGRFNYFPMASRCFVALHELYWGEFGDYCRRHPEGSSQTLLNTFQNKAIARLKKDAMSEEPLSMAQWLAKGNASDTEADLFQQGLAYLGSHATPSTSPWTYTMTQLPDANDLPMKVMRICEAEYIPERLAREIFFPNLKAAYV